MIDAAEIDQSWSTSTLPQGTTCLHWTRLPKKSSGSARRSRASTLSVKNFLASSANCRPPSACSRATAQTRRRKGPPRARRRPRRHKGSLKHNRVGDGAPKPPNQLASIAVRQASAIRSLAWQRARHSRKSPPHARGFARTIRHCDCPAQAGWPNRGARRQTLYRAFNSDGATHRGLTRRKSVGPFQ